MTESKRYEEAAWRVVPTRRCAYGDDDRGYCEEPATVHLWTQDHAGVEDGHTMSCDEHCSWFNERRHLVRDHHPVGDACGLPADWIYTHPVGGPGWCELEGFDWLAAVGEAPMPAEVPA